MKKVFLDNLPIWESGANKGRINWKESVGYSVKFIYDNITGYIKITDYKGKQKIQVEYNNKESIIRTRQLMCSNIGITIGVIQHDFRFNIGDVVKVNTGSVIVMRQIRLKNGKGRAYEVMCRNDNHKYVIGEYPLFDGRGCGVCVNRQIVPGVNDIGTTHPEIVHYLEDVKDAKRHTYGSSEKISVKCHTCNYKKEMIVSHLTNRGFSCPICNDSISYPEKFVFSLLKQLNLNFEIQYSINNKYYDFYVKELNCIIETHGKQHYENDFSWKGGRSLKEEKENDLYKEFLAKQHNISEYIVLDCRYSELEHVRNSILNSKLNSLIQIDTIDWDKCHKCAVSSIVFIVCQMWEDGYKNTKTLSKILKLSRPTIIKYLKQGATIGLCDYDAKGNMIANGRRNGLSGSNKTRVIKDGEVVGVFYSASEIERVSEETFGVKLWQTLISQICREGRGTHKGFTFEYAD